MLPNLPPIEVIAHRGASAHAPENTLSSFALALRLGADCLELDVRATSDGVPVVVHDPTLYRTAGLPHVIAETTAAELAALPDECRPPTLSEVLDAFGPRTGYLVEVKVISVEAEAAMLEAFARRGLHSRVTVQSFDHLLLRRLRRRDDALALAALFRPGADVAGALGLVAPFVDGVGPCADGLDEDLVEDAHRRGLFVRTWTVNETDAMEALVAAGVDGIITDRPERARAVVGAAARALAATGRPAGALPQARMAATSPA